jgi:hypothetical protein
MTEVYYHKGVRYEVTRLGVSHYIVKAGSRRADCKKTFDSLDKAREFTEYTLDAACKAIAGRCATDSRDV